MCEKMSAKEGEEGGRKDRGRTYMLIRDKREGGRRGRTYRRALGRVGGEDASEEVLGGLGEIGCVALVRLPEPVGASLLCGSKGGREEE